jgi:CSLREA domain-containing protein
LVITLALLLLFAGKGQIVHAASLTVTTTADELNVDGDCSLREAIQAANTDAAVDACLAGSGADTITVPAGNYVLSIAGAGENANGTGDLDITSDLTITGDGAATTMIDGSDLDRVLHIITGQVQVSRVTIRNGTYLFAGGISNQDGLTLINIILESNSAEFGSAIFNHGGTLEIYDSLIRSNDAIVKGGIFNGSLGAVLIKNSTISNNTGSHGGISNEGTVTIISSILNDNGATTDLGGAIGNSGSLTIEDSTLSGNSAGRGGAIFNWGNMSVTGSNFTGNITTDAGGGGAIANEISGVVTIHKSTFSDNRAENDGTGGAIGNEGNLSVTKSSFTGNTASCCGGAISNGENGVATIDGSTLSENSAVGGGALNNFGGDLTLFDVTVKNNTGRDGVGLFNMNSGIVSITRSTFRDNMATGHGGGILNFDGGVITIEKSMIHRNSAGGFGGGVYSGTGTVTLKGSEVNYNTAGQGGGIYNSDSLSLINSVVTGNKATSGPGSGGGIFNDGGAVTLTKSRVRGNWPDNCVGC